jgi:hypothetical protein
MSAGGIRSVVPVPFDTVTVLLNCLISVRVSPAAVWHWVQNAGQKAMDRLNDQLTELSAGQLPQMESLDEAISDEAISDEAISVLPLLIGADGVLVPFRPEACPRARGEWERWHGVARS